MAMRWCTLLLAATTVLTAPLAAAASADECAVGGGDAGGSQATASLLVPTAHVAACGGQMDAHDNDDWYATPAVSDTLSVTIVELCPARGWTATLDVLFDGTLGDSHRRGQPAANGCTRASYGSCSDADAGTAYIHVHRSAGEGRYTLRLRAAAC